MGGETGKLYQFVGVAGAQ